MSNLALPSSASTFFFVDGNRRTRRRACYASFVNRRSRKRLSTYLGRPSPTITQRRDNPPRTQVSLDFQRPREHDIDKKKCFERVNRGIEIQSNLAFLNECLARHGGRSLKRSSVAAVSVTDASREPGLRGRFNGKSQVIAIVQCGMTTPGHQKGQRPLCDHVATADNGGRELAISSSRQLTTTTTCAHSWLRVTLSLCRSQ